ncbi:MAG: peptidase inhibitor family I36 protein [Opitutales bacterium]
MHLKIRLLPLLGALAALPLFAQTTDFEGVVLYQDENYGGASFTVYPGEGIPSLRQYYADDWGWRTWNDLTSSVAVWGPVRVYLYKHSNYEGDYIVLEEHTPALQRWNDEISSVWVECREVYGWYEDTSLKSWVYEDESAWLYHDNGLGWIYGEYWDAAAGTGWLWDPALGWLYTSAATYPWLVGPNGTWHYYLEGSSAPRWFYTEALGWYTS